jgi:hypothetical protein
LPGSKSKNTPAEELTFIMSQGSFVVEVLMNLKSEKNMLKKKSHNLIPMKLKGTSNEPWGGTQ